MQRRLTATPQDERGQAVILVAIAIAALIAGLALAMDAGYGLTQRRVLQNEADAGAIAVGKGLATTVVVVNGSITFGLHQEEAWCLANSYASANGRLSASNGVPSLLVQFGDGATPPNWTTGVSSAACPASGTLTPVPGTTRFVRVEAGLTYPTLFGSVIGESTLGARASARAKLSGTPVPLGGPVWPMVRHYNPLDYNISAACPPTNCDPTTIDPMTFWSPNAGDVVYGNFKGMVDLSRYSTRYWPTRAAQFEMQWDQTGSASATPATALKPDHSGNCTAGWDTAGDESVSNQDKQCSIPNWFYYAFQGKLSLSSDWTALPANQESPSSIDTPARRSICTTPPDPAPSCDDSSLGDWIETAYGNVGQNESDNMRARIQAANHYTPFSNAIVPNGPNKGNVYGRALTILVYLWDCAETFDSSAAPGSQWSLITSRGNPDCSQIRANGSSPTPDRVHLFTVAPFTFYEGLVTSQAIQGYWGGSLGDARDCSTCALNALSNTAFLVPDD